MQTSGNTVLITGGSSGIGLALVKKFYGADNHVIVVGRDIVRLERVRQTYPAIEIFQGDITEQASLHGLVSYFPNVNVLVNCAGVQFNYDLSDQEIDASLINVEVLTNLVAPMQLIKLYLPELLQHPQAAIVNVSSGLALVPKQSAPLYCGSKAAVHIATKALRWQLEQTRIKVFELIPPLVDTPMTQSRNNPKISPEALAEEFWRAFQKDHYEIYAGRVKLLRFLNVLAPKLAERIMRGGA